MNRTELMVEGQKRYGTLKNSLDECVCGHAHEGEACGKCKCGEFEYRNIRGTFGDEIAHHEKDLGMPPKQAVAVAYAEKRKQS